MRYLMKALIKGSVVIFPLLITLWMVWSALSWLNELGLSVLNVLHLEAIVFPGSGLLIMLITLLGTGLLFQFNPVTWLYQYVEDALLRWLDKAKSWSCGANQCGKAAVMSISTW